MKTKAGICENNGYAVSTPVSVSTSVADIATRAAAYNMPGIIVDGQDAVAVFDAVGQAAQRARLGQGPSLIEAKTYRFREHAEFGALRVKPYRTEEEIAAWMARDPLKIHRSRLLECGLLDEASVAALSDSVDEEVTAAVTFAEESPTPVLTTHSRTCTRVP